MKLSLFIVKRRYCLLITATITMLLLVQILFLIFELLKVVPLSHSLAEHQIRLNYLDISSRLLQKEIKILTKYLIRLLEIVAYENSQYICYADERWCFPSNNKRKKYNIFNLLTPEMSTVLKICSAYFRKYPLEIDLPRINFLSHLLDKPMYSLLSFVVSKNRTGVTMVLGITTVKRLKANYLIPTLKNLTLNMNDVEKDETLIVVYIGETDMNYIISTVKEIQNEFTDLVENGLIDIIAPAKFYYPNFDDIYVTYDDSLDQVQWRAKQNLDVSLLMAYAQSKAKFYVHLEDDIVTKHEFITTMRKFAFSVSAEMHNNDWLILDFCRLGFIGKMFKSIDLSFVLTCFQIFFKDQPVDWLISTLYATIFCNCTIFDSQCANETINHWPHYKPAIFQHIGNYSSLPGKMQYVQDLTF